MTYAVVRQAIRDYYFKCYPPFTDSKQMPSEDISEYEWRVKNQEKRRKAERRSLRDFFLGEFYSRRMPNLKGEVMMEVIEQRRRHLVPMFDGK